MNKYLLAVSLLLVTTPSFAAQKTRSTLQSDITTNYGSGTGITAAKLRTQQNDVTDSCYNILSDNLTGAITTSGSLATSYNSVVPANKGGAGTISGLLKANGSGTVSQAIAATDYVSAGAVSGNGITMNTAKLLGRGTASTGSIEELTVGTGLLLTGTTLSAVASGSTNVTATSVMPDNTLVRADGGTREVQTSNVVVDDSGNLTGVGSIASGAQTITSNSTDALSVGQAGTTNPALKVNANTVSSVTGMEIVSGISGAGVTLNAISSNANADFIINPKGSGFSKVTGVGIQLISGGQNRFQVISGQVNATPGRLGNASLVPFSFFASAGSGLTASTEATTVYFNMGVTATHATGALVEQRDFRISPTTHAFAAASALTNASTLAIDGPPIGGTNATISTVNGIYIPTSTAANTTNAYGINITATTGATNNYAARFSGRTQLMGGVQHAIRIVTAAGAITVTNDDYTIVVNKTTGAATSVTLPTCNAANLGQVFIVKDGKKDANTNNITVTATIDGGSNDVITTNGASVQYQCDGTSGYWKE